jgi:hypothetical protein
VLDGVVPDSAVPRGLVVMGYRVIRNTEGVSGGIGVLPGFLPAGYVPHPVRGFVYARADPMIEIVVGLKATRPERFLIPGFTLHYHIGRTRYLAVYQQGAGLSPGAPAPNGCPIPE